MLEAPIWKQVGPVVRILVRQVFTASGRGRHDRNNETVWMFDNQIDWVKHIWNTVQELAAARRPAALGSF
jgi:hypothetical protein